MIENLFTFVRTLGNQRIEGKKFFVTQVGLLGTLSDNSGSIGTAGKVLSSTGSGVSWVTVGSSNVQNLNDLTDVVISTAATGNLLRYDGTSWVNWAPNFLTGYGSLNDLSDVTLTTPVNGSRLVYVHSTSQWIDAAPLSLNKIYYGTALGDAETSTVVTNGTRLGVGSLAMPTNLTVGQVDITTGVIGEGSIHIGGVDDADIYLLASKNKIQVGSQVTEFIPSETEGEEGTTETTFTPSTLNIQPLGGQSIFGGLVTANGFKTPSGIKKQILLADGTVSSTNAATSGQILRWIESGGVGQWVADDEGVSGIPGLEEVTDVGSTTTNSITAANLNTGGTLTAAVVTTPLIEREGVLTINSEQQVDQGEPNPNLLYVSWMGDNKFVVNADGYAIANAGFKVVGGTSSGFLKANGTIDTNTYLTSYTETQTLDAVTDLGNTTTNTINVGGVTAPELNYGGLLTINADSDGGLQPEQGNPAVPVLSFEWAGTQQGYIDTDGKITFNGFKTPSGTSSGFLKANGTVDTNAYITEVEYIDDIGDVTISSAATGDVLMFDGSEWVNAAIDNADYVSKVQHEVKAGVAITKGQAVYVTSADGTNMIVGLASNASEATSSKTIGLALSTAAINGHFFVITEGLIDGLNTAGATAGQPVWLGTNGNLIFGLTNKPVAPAHLVYIGVVTRANANNGEIFVHIQNGFELNEIHDALIASPTFGQLLRRDSDGLWKNWTPNYITADSVDVLTNKRINLSTGLTSATPVDSIDGFLGQNDILLYQDGIDKGGTINVDEQGNITISNPGIGYYSGDAATEGGSRFSVTVAGNTLTGTIAEFNAALTDGDFATQAYVSTQIANLVDGAPTTLDTLNELAAALGDDANFATTVATSIGTKQNQLNGTGFVKANGTTITYDNSSYITTESDPVFVSSAAYGITSENITNWDAAFDWGNHADAGYLTSLPDHTHTISDVTGLQTALDGKAALSHNHDDRYYTESESDLRFYLATNPSDYQTTIGTVANVASGAISNLSAAWTAPGTSISNGFRVYRYNSDATNKPVTGDNANWLINIYSHPSGGTASYGHQLAAANSNNIYFRSVSNGSFSDWHKFWSTNDFSSTTISNWNTAYSWGNHATAGYLTSIPDEYLTQTEGDALYQPIGSYLTAEADTLATVTGRGNSTTNAISVGSLSIPSFIYLTNAGTGNAFISESWGINLNGVSTHPVQVRGGSLSVGYTLGGGTNYGTNNLYVAGNFGLGNTAPNQKLELSVGNGVTGGLRINYAASAVSEGMDITYLNTGSTVTSFDSRYISDSAVMQFRMKTYGGSPVTAMTILGNGNVGINNTNPTAKLQVGPEAHSSATGIEVAAGAGGANLLARDSSSHHNWFPFTDGENYYSAAGHSFRSADHGTPWVTITASDFTWGGNTVATRTWVTSQGYLTSLPSHNHDDRYYTETESDDRYVNVSGDTMTGNFTLKYSTADSSDYNGLMFAPYSDEAGLNDYIIKAASDKGVFGRKSFGWHVHSESAFGVYSNGWVKLFGVEGDTGNTQVFGSLTVDGSITENSSIRYKKDVVDIEPASSRVELLRPVRYKKIKDESEEIGLIAEDVAELFPEVVKYDNEGRPDGVNYSRLSVILLKAVQELSQEVNELKKKLN